MKEGPEATIISWRSTLRGLWHLAEHNERDFLYWWEARDKIMENFEYQNTKYMKKKIKKSLKFIKYILRKF